MNRYNPPRRGSKSQASGPLVAFLLIACFGLLFVTGCSSQNTAEKTEDDTFTEEDIARFRELSQGSADMPLSSGTGASAGSVIVEASAEPLRTDTGSAVPLVRIDPLIKKKYDAMRATSSGNGANAYRVTNTFLNVRATPAVSGESVGRLDQGDIVTLVEFPNATWAKIALADGKQGYVANRYLSKLTTEEKLKDEQKAFDGQYFVNFAFVNVRKEPNTGSEKTGEIPGQAFVRPIGIDKDWAKIMLDGKEGYVSMQFLSPFKPNFLVRQERYQVPILHYDVGQDGVLKSLGEQAARLKQDGVKFLTFRELYDTVQTQEVRDVRLPPRPAIIAVSGITTGNVRQVSDALTTAGVPATLFIQTDQVGISGISEKILQTLSANGFDIQSAGHTGDDLRTLTNAQTQLELEQSRGLLEQYTHKTVFAVAYPQGAANDRVLTQAADAGYLFGMSSAPDKAFSRDQFLRLPSYSITAGMSVDDVVKLTK